MANGLSNYVEAKVLDWVFKQTAFGSAPTVLYVSLHSADPGDTGASELSGNSYARAQLNPDTNNSTDVNWNAKGTSGQAATMSNKLDITFPTATGNWTTATYFGIWDASSSGNLLWSGAITGGLTVNNGNTAKFTAGTPGQLVVTID